MTNKITDLKEIINDSIDVKTLLLGDDFILKKISSVIDCIIHAFPENFNISCMDIILDQ